MKNFSFSSPYFLLLFLPLAYSFVKGLKHSKHGSLIVSSLKTLEQSVEALKRKKKTLFSPSRFLHTLRHLGLACIIFGLARPQLVQTQGKKQTQGIDIVLALDLSSSMLALDFSKSNQVMTRVEAVKAVLQEFIKKRPNDAIGLIGFAGNPYLVSPLTLNHDWLVQNLNRCNVGLIEDGTAIGSALVMAVNRLQASHKDAALSALHAGQIVILLTDGVNNKGEISPELAAELAAHYKIKVYTIGVGEGGIVPTLLLDDTGNIVKNAWGQLQVAQAQIPIDDTTLRHIAEKTGGLFFQAKDKKQLASIYEVIDTIEKRDLPLALPEQVKDYFWIPLLLALAFFSIEWTLSHTRFQVLP